MHKTTSFGQVYQLLSVGSSAERSGLGLISNLDMSLITKVISEVNGAFLVVS